MSGRRILIFGGVLTVIPIVALAYLFFSDAGPKTPVPPRDEILAEPSGEPVAENTQDRVYPKADNSYLLATSEIGGIDYAVGIGVATLVRVKMIEADNVSMSVLEAGPPNEIIAKMMSGEAQFAVLPGLAAAQAWQGLAGVPEEQAQAHLRSMTMLWLDVAHLVCRSDQDLDGPSGANLDTDVGFFDEDSQAAMAALTNDEFACVFVSAAPPDEAITTALGSGAVLGDITDEERAGMDNGRGIWSRYVIPADTYPGQEVPIETMAEANSLFVRADIDPDHVHAILTEIYDKIGFVRNVHAATEVMSIDRALDGVVVPLHPGAQRFFQERGLDIPERLLP